MTTVYILGFLSTAKAVSVSWLLDSASPSQQDSFTQPSPYFLPKCSKPFSTSRPIQLKPGRMQTSMHWSSHTLPLLDFLSISSTQQYFLSLAIKLPGKLESKRFQKLLKCPFHGSIFLKTTVDNSPLNFLLIV